MLYVLPLILTVPPLTYVCTTVDVPTATWNVFVVKLSVSTANRLLCVNKSIFCTTLLTIAFAFVIAALVSCP